MKMQMHFAETTCGGRGNILVDRDRTLQDVGCSENYSWEPAEVKQGLSKPEKRPGNSHPVKSCPATEAVNPATRGHRALARAINPRHDVIEGGFGADIYYSIDPHSKSHEIGMTLSIL